MTGTQPNNPSGSQATNDMFQVNPDDAIVTIITLPPRSAYFGFQTYALERAPSIYGQTAKATCTAGNKALQTYVQTEDCNYEIFGNFTNTVDHADITAAVSAFNGNPWNIYDISQTPPAPNTFKTIAIITTPNKTVAANMISLFTGDATRIFTETMPASTKSGDTHTGSLLYPCSTNVNTPCDTYTSLIRDTLAQSSNAQRAWQIGNNVVTYRVTLPTVGVGPTNLYDTDDVYSALYTQGCNTNETGATGAPSSCVTPTTASASFDYDLQQIAMVLQAYGTASSPTGDAYSFFEASNGGISINGGVGTCLNSGRNCAGATQDTDAYRGYNAGTLKNLAPIFVVGVLHSTSPADFTPSPNYPVAAVNNADYTGISIADGSTYPGIPTPAVSQNVGIADAANPNSTSQYAVPPTSRALLGSAYTVLNYLTDTSGHTLYSDLPSSVQKDINNIYIHVFQRNDGPTSACAMQTCANNLANDVTTVTTGLVAGPPVNNNPGVLPDNDYAALTERGYVLPPASGVAQTSANFTGAAAQYLQSPYVVCDTVGTGCGSAPQ